MALGRVVKKGDLRWLLSQNGGWSVKTDSSSEEEDLHVDVNFDEPIDLAIN